jgi:hypothetical protein
MMSLAKAVPDGLKDRECNRTVLRKCSPVPYIPGKDPVQETVSALKDQHLKTHIGEDTTLHLSIWHNGTKEAFLMHVGSMLDAVKKRGHFKDPQKAEVLYVSQKEAAKQAKAALALLDGVNEGAEKSKKSPRKAKKAKKMAEESDPEMQANFLLDLKKAKEATENAKGAMTTAANKMFQFYANLLLVEARYMWNKIVTEQMASNPYINLQGVSQKGPRGVSRQSFEFPMRLSKRSFISPTCSRSPSMSACVNVYVL